MRPELRDAIDALPELRDETRRDVPEIFRRFSDPSSWLQINPPIDVERADLSDEDLRTAIREGRLRLGMVETSTPVGEKRLRRGQAALRTQTLENYRFSCALCDVADPRLLIASHVIPWSIRAETRGLLRSIICLCRFHDALFETGYWSLTDDLQVIRRTGIDSHTISALLPPTCSFSRPNECLPALSSFVIIGKLIATKREKRRQPVTTPDTLTGGTPVPHHTLSDADRLRPLARRVFAARPRYFSGPASSVVPQHTHSRDRTRCRRLD